MQSHKASAQEVGADRSTDIHLRFNLQLRENSFSSNLQTSHHRLFDVMNYTFDLIGASEGIRESTVTLEDTVVTVSDQVVSFNGILKLQNQIPPNIVETHPLTFSGILIVDKIQKNTITGEMRYVFNKDSTITVGKFTSADNSNQEGTSNIQLILSPQNNGTSTLNGTISSMDPLL